MKHLLTTCIILLSLTCFSQKKEIQYEGKTQAFPLTNEIITKSIGEVVYLEEEYLYKEGIVLTNVPKFTITLTRYPLESGVHLPLKTIDSNANKIYYDESIGSNASYQFGVIIAPDDTVYPFSRVKGGISYYKKKKIEGFKIEESIYIKPDCNFCFRYELIYTGKSNNVLKFSYKEYKGDMARPAFFQDLEYNLDDGNIISFKKLKIEVIKTDNLGIEYKVHDEDTFNNEVNAYSESTITRAQAIKTLKDKKDLLDLEIITQEEYDKVKNEMSQYIK